jgi:hypothetical protein
MNINSRRILKNANLLVWGFVVGDITRLHPVHVPNRAVLVDMVRLCHFNSNGAAFPFLKQSAKVKLLKHIWDVLFNQPTTNRCLKYLTRSRFE